MWIRRAVPGRLQPRSNRASKIKYIQNCANSNVSLLNRYFTDELLNDILMWKEERNRLIHALLNQDFEHNEISELAERGNELVKLLRNRSGSYNRAIERERMKNLSER
jgi:hypothetical protein